VKEKKIKGKREWFKPDPPTAPPLRSDFVRLKKLSDNLVLVLMKNFSP
jgi:hypothetical protein